MEHIHAVNQVMEKSSGYNKPICIAFIDYEKEFDSISTASVLEALKGHGMEKTYIRLLDEICTGRIILHKKGEKFFI